MKFLCIAFLKRLCYNKVNEIYRRWPMELGKRLQQARLEAGLSQKQLCGDRITRNMLSQIEHDTAKPSMTTLQYLAERLGKSVGYFLEENTPPDAQAILSARQAWQEQDPQGVLSALEGYRKNELLDNEYWYLTALANIALAEHALEQKKTEYARALLEQAALAEENTIYRWGLTERRLTLQHLTGMGNGNLPDNTWECILRGQSALEAGRAEDAVRYLQGAEDLTNANLQHLLGKAYQALGEYALAIDCFTQVENPFPQVAENLEICYRELGNFQKAYEYACKQR